MSDWTARLVAEKRVRLGHCVIRMARIAAIAVLRVGGLRRIGRAVILRLPVRILIRILSLRRTDRGLPRVLRRHRTAGGGVGRAGIGVITVGRARRNLPVLRRILRGLILLPGGPGGRRRIGIVIIFHKIDLFPL